MTAATEHSTTGHEALAQQIAQTTAQHLTFAIRQHDRDLIEQLLLPLSRQDLWALVVAQAAAAPPARSRPEDGLIDDIAVERAAQGEPLTKTERDRAIRRMDRRGIALRVIAEQFGVSVKTVKRALAEPRPVQTRLGEPPRQEVSSPRRAAGETSRGEVA
jgi:hypothetical protein